MTQGFFQTGYYVEAEQFLDTNALPAGVMQEGDGRFLYTIGQVETIYPGQWIVKRHFALKPEILDPSVFHALYVSSAPQSSVPKTAYSVSEVG